MVHAFAHEPLWLGLFSSPEDRHAFSSFGHQRAALLTSYFVRALSPWLPFSSSSALLTRPSLFLYVELTFDHAALPPSPSKFTSCKYYTLYGRLLTIVALYQTRLYILTLVVHYWTRFPSYLFVEFVVFGRPSVIT